MLLAIDIGNTQTSFGVYSKNELKHHWRAETRNSRTPDEYAAYLFPLLSHAGLKGSDIKAVLICSVVPPLEYAFSTFSKQFFNLPAFKVNSQLKLGFSMNVDVPSEVGADRIANAAYAIKRLTLPSIVIDLGTATTFDIVSKEKGYEGGVILPGLRMGVEALGSRTAKLPLVELEFPKKVIGKNTIDCIRSGILFGYVDLLDGLLDRTLGELGGKASIALTGGLSGLFHKRIKHKSELLPNLTLDGIVDLYLQNQ